jgi:hypothetical protein
MLGPTTRANVHVPTVLAIGVVCFAAVTVIHEALGHGLACILVGQGAGRLQHGTALRRTRGWSPSGRDRRRQHRQHRGRVGRYGRRDGAGPGRWRLVVCAVAVWGTNLFHAGNYLLIGPLTGFGDWSSVARPWSRRWSGPSGSPCWATG